MHFEESFSYTVGEKVYEGFGNPDAWILVVGNEPDFDVPVGRVSGMTARKYQHFIDYLSLRKRAPGYQFYNRIFFTDIRQIVGKDIWLSDAELIKSYFADDFESFFGCDFVQQFPIVIISLEDEVWKYSLDIAKLLKVDKKGSLRESKDGSQWYNLFERRSPKDPRLVIHTRQISHKETNRAFVHMVMSELYDFCIKRHIHIHTPNRDQPTIIPKQALEMGNFIMEIIDAANAPIDEIPVVRCRRKRCKGTMVITVAADNSIIYHCTHCDKSSGVIYRDGEE